MATIISGEQINGNKFSPVSAGLSNFTVASASQLQIGNINAQWVAPFAGQIVALSGTNNLGSGSTSNTCKLQAYKNGSAIASAVTASPAAPTTNVSNMVWTVSGTPVTFAAGDMLSIYCVVSGSISSLNITGVLTVSTF